MRRTAARLIFVSADEKTKPTVQYETGEWTFSREKMARFASWCKQNRVRANNNVKITGSEHFARCLRASHELAPGQAIITAPPTACFNMLVASQQQMSQPNGFPIQIDWLNWNLRLPFLLSQTHGDFATAGWMARQLSLEEPPFAEYFSWLCDDSRGKHGLSQGIAREKGDENPVLDMQISQMTSDACEEGEVFLDRFLMCYAVLLSRSVAIEHDAIAHYIRGTTFFKSNMSTLFVPTLIPLVDCCPHRDDHQHNCLTEFFTAERVRQAPEQLADELYLKPEQVLEYSTHGFFALRALSVLDEGDLLYVRGWPKMGGLDSKEYADMGTTNASIQQRRDREF